jgi:hypothetical protein
VQKAVQNNLAIRPYRPNGKIQEKNRIIVQKMRALVNKPPFSAVTWYRGTEVVGKGTELNMVVSERDTGEYVCEAVNCKLSRVRYVQRIT